MVITALSSNEQALAELGARLRARRIEIPLTQQELADRAGVSLSMVARVEQGRDVRASNLLSVLRALGLLAQLDALVPEATVRPTDLVELGHVRRRATSAARRVQATADAWVWGDERADAR
jgi:transcriptional regulator with XRE-family HTH domain